jgi:hypothetical protein
MMLNHDLRMYQDRWLAVEAILAEERRAAALELRWRQLNAAYGLAKALAHFGQVRISDIIGTVDSK